MQKLIDGIKELRNDAEEMRAIAQANGDRSWEYCRWLSQVYAYDKATELIDEYQEGLFSELRGLLKEHAQFPKQWDTDERLIDWLKEKGEY